MVLQDALDVLKIHIQSLGDVDRMASDIVELAVIWLRPPIWLKWGRIFFSFFDRSDLVPDRPNSSLFEIGD